MPSIVGIYGQKQGSTPEFLGSGLLLDSRHVLTAAHVARDASIAGMKPAVGLLAGRETPASAKVLAYHGRYDAAILELTGWTVRLGLEQPQLSDHYDDLGGQRVDLHAVTPTSRVQIEAGNYSVTGYDDEHEEYELSPGVMGGNSGGVIEHDGSLIGLVIETAADGGPLHRVLALHVLRDWIADELGRPNSSPPQYPIGDISERGVKNLSHQIDSIHLHVDGAQARDVVMVMLNRHRQAGLAAELASVNEALRGPQRGGVMSRTYQLHTPGPAEREQLDFFSTTLFHDGVQPVTHAQRQKIWLAVHDVLCQLDEEGDNARDVVVELERVVGFVDSEGVVKMAPSLSLAEAGGGLETMVGRHLFLPFNTPNSRRTGLAAYELHFSIDIPRSSNEAKRPVELARLADLMQRAGLELGGWFLFHDDERWAYRSNAFVPEVSLASLSNRWNKLKAQLSADANPALKAARLRLLAEEALAVWKTPLLPASKEAKTVAELATWERDVEGLTEFWVSLPNFLGDQKDAVRDAMLLNFDRDVRYVYFLRSDADAKRWLDFRQRMQNQSDKANGLMSAYVVAFDPPNSWDQSAAFIANPRSSRPEAYSLRIDTTSNRVLSGMRIADGKVADIVHMLSPVLTGGAITFWQLVRPSGGLLEVATVCVNLLDKPSDELFELLDSKLALLASELNGEVVLYGNRSISVVFQGNRQGLARACSFARRVAIECPFISPSREAFTMRIGVDFGDARQAMRACGLLWTGPAIAGAREVLHGAPQRPGLFLTSNAAQRCKGQSGIELRELQGGVTELM